MADTLIGNTNDKYYRESAILTARHNLIKVMVEDEEDMSFWRDLLHWSRPDKKFALTPYSASGTDVSPLTKGKDLIKRFVSQLGVNFICCIDSDLDFVLKDFDDEKSDLWKNRFVIQTCAYSMENLLCQPEVWSNIIYECSLEEADGEDFNGFMARLSLITFPVLSWLCFLILTNHRHPSVKSTWNEILDTNKLPKYNDPDVMLSEIEKRVKEWVSNVEKTYNELTKEHHDFEISLLEKGIVTKESTWYFIRGHNLKNYILEAILKPIVEGFRARRIKNYKESGADEQVIKDNLNHYLNVCQSPERLLMHEKKWKDYSAYSALIKERINQSLCS